MHVQGMHFSIGDRVHVSLPDGTKQTGVVSIYDPVSELYDLILDSLYSGSDELCGVSGDRLTKLGNMCPVSLQSENSNYLIELAGKFFSASDFHSSILLLRKAMNCLECSSVCILLVGKKVVLGSEVRDTGDGTFSTASGESAFIDACGELDAKHTFKLYDAQQVSIFGRREYKRSSLFYIRVPAMLQANILLEISKAYIRLGLYPEAIEQLTMCLYVTGLVGSVSSYETMRQMLGLVDASELVTLSNLYAQAIYLRAECKVTLGRSQGAVADAQRACEVSLVLSPKGSSFGIDPNCRLLLDRAQALHQQESARSRALASQVLNLCQSRSQAPDRLAG